MAGAYFVCGMQLIFLATHLPSYLALCGMDPMLSAKALAMIAVFNVAGSLFFGWAGGRWSKQALLGGLYVTRSWCWRSTSRRRRHRSARWSSPPAWASCGWASVR